jgi:exodeoxyribonuclease VII large subunit
VRVEAIDYGDRKVYSVASFNAGVASWLARLPTVWVEGEVTELRRQERWASVFLTLKDPQDGSCLGVSMPRGQFDALRLELADGARVHVYGRPELYEARGEFRLRALSLERFGLGDHLAALERLKEKLAGEGLFAAERKRALPFLPRRIGLVTGNDAAAKRDVLTAIATRFPPASIVVAETYVQGPRAAPAVVDALRRLAEVPEVDVIVVARGGGSFEDLLPFSDERLVRAVASCPVPIVTAVGHEQDTPLCDLAADVRASTPSVAGRLVVPDLRELRGRLDVARGSLERCARRTFDLERQRLGLSHERLGRAPGALLDRERARLATTHERLGRAPALLLERRRARLEQAAGKLRTLSPRATLGRGYAIVRAGGKLVRSAEQVASGDRVAVELGEGGFGATVE